MEDKKPSPDWPSQGKVEFLDYSVRYREGLDLVLKNLTLSVVGGEKVRTTGLNGVRKTCILNTMHIDAATRPQMQSQINGEN